MTLKDVAKLANVSVSTASKAINGARDVSESTRLEILEIAEKAGYFSEKKRISLENKSKNNFTVAIICPEIISIHYSEHVTAITREVESLGGNCIVYVYNFEEAQLDRMVEICDNDKNIHAIVSLTGITTKNTPLLVEIPAEYTIQTNTSVDKAIEYLKSLGHTKIGFAGESHTASKMKTFNKACPTNTKYVYVSNERFEKAGEQAAEYYVKNGMPTAVICAYDEIAFGLIDRFEQLKVNVPDDISVVGINNIKPAKYCFGGVTTVETGWNEAVKDEIRKLYELVVENKTDIIRRTVVASPYVVERATVKKYSK